MILKRGDLIDFCHHKGFWWQEGAGAHSGLWKAQYCDGRNPWGCNWEEKCSQIYLIEATELVKVGFSILAQLMFGAGWSLVVGAVLCITDCLAASLSSAQWMLVPVSPPRCDIPKCLQTLPDVPWGVESPLTENHCVKLRPISLQEGNKDVFNVFKNITYIAC